jgi:hypothetical protein
MGECSNGSTRRFQLADRTSGGQGRWSKKKGRLVVAAAAAVVVGGVGEVGGREELKSCLMVFMVGEMSWLRVGSKW